MKPRIENNCPSQSVDHKLNLTLPKYPARPFHFSAGRSQATKLYNLYSKPNPTKVRSSSKTLLRNLYRLGNSNKLTQSKTEISKQKGRKKSQRELLIRSIDRHQKISEIACQIEIKIGGSVKIYSHKAATAQRLFQFLREKYDKIEYWKSFPENVALDYFLSFPKNDISFLNGERIALQPYETQKQKMVTIDSFDILHCIGTGGFSKVFLCRCKQNGSFYAMKVIDKNFILKNKKKKIVLIEKKIMETLQHPFIIQMKFAFQSHQSLIFVLELCPGGELFGLVKKFRIMNESIARFYMIQILLGLEEIHKNGIVYRDFKPENILIDMQGHIRIADFGLAKPGIFNIKQKAYSFCGSPEYMPPQMIMKNGHSLPVDFYCLGALLYELVTGLPPFYSEDPTQIFQGTVSKNLTFPDYVEISQALKELLIGLLSKDESQRLGTFKGVNEVLFHPWFGKINKQSYLKKQVEAPVKFTKIKDLNLIFQEMKIKNQHYLLDVISQQGKVDFVCPASKFYFDFRRLPAESWREISKKENSVRVMSSNSCRFSIKGKSSKEKSLKNIFSHRSATGHNLIRKKPLTARYLDINLYLK